MLYMLSRAISEANMDFRLNHYHPFTRQSQHNYFQHACPIETHSNQH